MLKIAMLSKWHVHAKDYAKQFLASGKARITVVWDEDPERGAAWAQELSCDFEPSLDKVMARGDVDAVVIDSPTNMHLDIIRKATAAKKHIYTEKTLCLTEADALEAARLIREAGVKFVISMPQLVSPEIQFIKQAIDAGWLGRVSVFRMRNAHNGSSANWLPSYWYDPEAAGGGAMMDLGCHSVYIANWLFGAPKRVAAIYNTLDNRPVDDNAMMSVEYQNQAVAILETSFVSFRSPRMLEVYGDQGAIQWTRQGLEMISTVQPGFEDWQTVTDLPPALLTPVEQFIAAILEDDDSHIFSGLEMGVALSNVLEKSYLSNQHNQIVAF
jgi:1,5-anhydro-D-fructose reductase (1,5-anhydro-D-mannitol-forming)